MAENIVELLTDVADAIREKKGSNEPINAQNFAEEIKNLPSGGGDNDGIPSAVKDNNGNGVTNITTLSFNASVVEVAHYAYYGCRNLQEVSFNNGLSYIGMGAFYECAIETLNLPSTINYLGKQCFAKMAALKTFTIPLDAPLTTLPNNMLWNSPLLTKFIVPKNIDKLEGYVFEGCSGLEYIDFSLLTKVPTLANTTPFSGVTKAKFIVPDALYDEWISATNWATFADRIVKDSEYTRPL
jgi:hypothetical protein